MSVDVKYFRNVANHGRGSSMTKAIHELCDHIEKTGILCPFCKETDFDLIGLRLHYLRGHCEEFNDTPDPPSRLTKDGGES